MMKDKPKKLHKHEPIKVKDALKVTADHNMKAGNAHTRGTTDHLAIEKKPHKPVSIIGPKKGTRNTVKKGKKMNGMGVAYLGE